MARQFAHFHALGCALQLRHQVEAGQGGVELIAQAAADFAFDEVGAGEHAQPQPQRVVVVGRGAGFEIRSVSHRRFS
ncbi:hypothetical protein D3C77_754240 [compost metagenome]